jgi:protein SCO1/2
MNEPMHHLTLFPILAAALALATAGCSPGGTGAPPLQGAAIGGPFELTDQDGRKVRDSAFAGKYRLIYFGYSFCPDVCPTDLQSIGLGLAQFEKSDPERARQVQPIFITVDPERDTPQVLKPYVAAFHPRLIGLTGSAAEIDDVKKRFAIFSATQQTEGASDYLVDHSRQTILFGTKGEPIALIPSDEGPDAVAEALRKWVA